MIKTVCINKDCEFYNFNYKENCSGLGLHRYTDFAELFTCPDAILGKRIIEDIPFYRKATGAVYVLNIKGNIYKIGQSINVESRVKEIKSYYPHNTILYCTIEANDIMRLEFLIHKYLKRFKIKGEFFEVDKHTLEQAINDAIKIINTEKLKYTK